MIHEAFGDCWVLRYSRAGLENGECMSRSNRDGVDEAAFEMVQ